MSDELLEIKLHFSLTSSPSTPRITRIIGKDTKASQLRQVAADATKIPLSGIKLIFRGRIIQNDDKVISEYNVENDCVIHCLGKPAPNDTSSSSAGAAFSTTSTSSATEGTTTSSMKSALKALKSKNTTDVTITAYNTLSKVVENILKNPNEEKYRKLKQSNAAFGRRLGNVQGGHDVMLAVGFISEIPDGADELHYVLKPNADAWNTLVNSKKFIDEAISQLNIIQPTPPLPSPIPPMPFGGSGVGGGMGAGMPSMPGMPPMTPAMQQYMQNMISDPNALRTMLQNPMVRQAMQNDSRVANNPMLRQALDDPNTINRISQLMSDPSMRQMMNNPALMQSMMDMGGMNAGMNVNMPQTPTPSPPTQPNPETFARMIQGFAQMQGSSNNTNSSNTQQPSSNSVSNSSTNNENEMTEEEMIAEAIARSLRDP